MPKRFLLLLIVLSLLAAACAAPVLQAPAVPSATPALVAEPAAAEPTPTPVPELAPASSGAIPLDALRNATYSGVYEQPITFADGIYQGEPMAGDLARPQVQLVDHATLSGDLDGDGVDDAVVFLVERGGGSGVFTYVAAQLNRAGQPLDAGAIRIEDRIQVKSAAIADGQVTLKIVTQGPGDVACCGTHLAAKTYALEQGQLVDTTTAGGELVKVSAADLDGTRWTLLDLNGDQLAMTDAAATLSFQDGQVAGSGGCNDYTASFSLDEVNPFALTLGPVAATRRACPDPAGAQEAAYFAALQSASQWAYVFGHLALYTQDNGGEQGRLLFAAQAAPAGAAATVETDDFIAASSLTRNGFAKDDAQMRGLDGQVVKLWGFVDQGNIYGDEGAQAILGDWWSGAGPDASTWRFNLKANAGDATGQSFAVHVPNDAGRDALLRAFVADAQAGRPTRVFVTGRLSTFDAPVANGSLTGLDMELQSSSDIRLEGPEQE